MFSRGYQAGSVTKSLSKMAKSKSIVLIGGSIYEKSEGKQFKTSVVFRSKRKNDWKVLY